MTDIWGLARKSSQPGYETPSGYKATTDLTCPELAYLRETPNIHILSPVRPPFPFSTLSYENPSVKQVICVLWKAGHCVSGSHALAMVAVVAVGDGLDVVALVALAIIPLLRCHHSGS